MAEATPWQLSKAGQVTLPVHITRTVVSHGTEPWPYKAEVIETSTTGNNLVEYGVNTHLPS